LFFRKADEIRNIMKKYGKGPKWQKRMAQREDFNYDDHQLGIP
jgi:hypothetical protein